MIRETIEALGPPGALPPEEAVLASRGPELLHEAEAICALVALRRLDWSAETNMGSQKSLVVFLILFMSSLILAFPIAMKISPDDGSKRDVV